MATVTVKFTHNYETPNSWQLHSQHEFAEYVRIETFTTRRCPRVIITTVTKVVINTTAVVILLSTSSTLYFHHHHHHHCELTTSFSTNFSFDVVSAKDRLLQFQSVHYEERHAERLQCILHVLAVEDHLQYPNSTPLLHLLASPCFNDTNSLTIFTFSYTDCFSLASAGARGLYEGQSINKLQIQNGIILLICKTQTRHNST